MKGISLSQNKEPIKKLIIFKIKEKNRDLTSTNKTKLDKE